MSKKRELVFTVHHEDQIVAVFNRAKDAARVALRAGAVMVRLCRPTRTLDQNAKMWPMLTDIAKQVPWHVVDPGGEIREVKLEPEEWKDVLTAALEKQRMVPGVDGGYVYLGSHTSRMNRAEFSQLIELIYAFGANHNVVWSEPVRAERKAA